VIPLSKPVPVSDFLELWYAAVESLKEVPADPQVKDPNRIYYTPVKFSDTSPYEFHVEAGEPLDWEKFLGGGSDETDQMSERPQAYDGEESANLQPPTSQATNEQGDASNGHGALFGGSVVPASSNAISAVSNYLSSRDARHEELCSRIMARGKLNTRGNYDARCLAHGGKGTSALFLNPRSRAVSCNRGCPYEELLIAEGLPDFILPSRELASVASPLGTTTATRPSPPAATATLPSGSNITPPLITAARLHVINALLLAHCFELTPDDEKKVRRYWGDPFSEVIEWPGTDTKLPVKICSFPSRRLQLVAAQRLSQEFNLEGIPGFYRALDLPGPEGNQRRDELAEYGPWRISLDQLRMKPGAVLAPYDNGSGFIVGIRIYPRINDKVPFLLTSRGLPGGARAVGYREASAA
jgi:hypothetical protein